MYNDTDGRSPSQTKDAGETRREQIEERSLVDSVRAPAHEAQSVDKLSAVATVAAPHDASVTDMHVHVHRYLLPAYLLDVLALIGQGSMILGGKT